jgi:hypothetical protein
MSHFSFGLAGNGPLFNGLALLASPAGRSHVRARIRLPDLRIWDDGKLIGTVSAVPRQQTFARERLLRAKNRHGDMGGFRKVTKATAETLSVD